MRCDNCGAEVEFLIQELCVSCYESAIREAQRRREQY